MEPLTIFCAYAAEDKSLYKRLKDHLKPLEREYQLKIWGGDTILPGRNRTKEVDKHFNLACIILLLISPDFMSSDYCRDIEKRAFERQQACHLPHIIPVLLRPIHWEYTAIGHLQVLPDNTTPVILWPNRDQAFLNIAMGIRQVIETIRPLTDASVPVSRATETPNLMKPTGKAHKEVPIRDYIYISDTKMMNRLEQQIGWKEEDIAPVQQRYQALHATLLQLEQAQKIWNVQHDRKFKTGDYVSGTCPMRWGIVNWGPKVCFFFATLPSRIILMAGSAYHLEGDRQSSREVSLGIQGNGSTLPGIMSAIEFAAEHSNVKWSQGIGSISDYLFALAFVQGKFFYELKIGQLATGFYEQTLEFTALVHKTLSPPSAQDIRSFFQSNVINKKDKQEINQMLSSASEILICSPVYVSLGQE